MIFKPSLSRPITTAGMKKAFLTLIFSLTMAGCIPAVETIPGSARTTCDTEGCKFLRELGSMVQRADRIVVTEHSFELDAYDYDAGKSLIEEPIVYATRELSAQQKAAFATRLDQLDTETQDAFPACVFQPHHSIRFYAGDALLSTMDICFECGQVEWDATRKTPPRSLYGGLAGFIEEIGLQPERDWEALAKQQLQ